MLIYCKECEHQCSDKADVCPGCGNPLRKNAPAELARPVQVMAQPIPPATYIWQPPEVQTTEKTGKKWKGMQLLGVLGLIVSTTGFAVSLSMVPLDEPDGSLGGAPIFSIGVMLSIGMIVYARIAAWWYHA